ncbi:GroES-like protein [Canariomyces notabilis]|uniref:GroES-like protein n=1 Tax=Canariomyces notabilis TaxID=2074819 RepID=A0AAN6TEC6_9PEZI|nr:GroES-like protein [Canariomyces arenarius]
MRSPVAPRSCPPAGYEVPNDVLIRVHAAAVQTGDTQAAAGAFKLLVTTNKSGSGVVIAVGSGVKSLRVGDAVYGLAFKHGQLFPERAAPGFASDFTIVSAEFLLVKPAHLSFEEAAALAGSVLTAYQCVKRYFEITGQPPGISTLEGKTVFIPGGLSATGSVYTQIVKNVYGAKSVVSTVSTPKIDLVQQYLRGIVDKVVNYHTQNIVQEVGRGTVDFVLNTQWDLVGTFPLVNPQTGAVVSIASVPSPRTVKQDFVSGNHGNREDLERSGEWIAARKIRAVLTVVDIDDIDAVRKACTMVATGKGGISKLVIRLA